jgi:hypothetical protein
MVQKSSSWEEVRRLFADCSKKKMNLEFDLLRRS